MTELVDDDQRTGARALRTSAAAWFVTTALGQLLFVAYVLGFCIL